MIAHQITYTLSKEKWQTVSILENNDPIVFVQPTEKLYVANPEIKVRKQLIQMLESAANNLPDNIMLYLIEGVRSIEDQKKAWDKSCEEIRIEFPNRDDEFYQQQTGLLVAKPLPLANHNCGGAVDVQLIYKDSGEFVDMGTLAKAGFGYALTQMLSDTITQNQKENRTVLREAMEKAGFVWYPGEWWHYCYGDRMWAVYTGRTECFFGPIQGIRR
jgi:D-alanyl-D-alanine dipeptidase